MAKHHPRPSQAPQASAPPAEQPSPPAVDPVVDDMGDGAPAAGADGDDATGGADGAPEDEARALAAAGAQGPIVDDAALDRAPGPALIDTRIAAPARMLAVIALRERDDPALVDRLATLCGAAADFLRVAAVLRGDLPDDVRAAIDAVVERI